MKIKKLIAVTMVVFSLLSVVLCCPLVASAKGEKHNPYYYSAIPGRVLYYKSSSIIKGDDVKWLQAALNVINSANLDIDGSFGKGTETAVKNFQSKYGLSKDGSCGSATRTKIVNLLTEKGFVEEGTYVIESGITNKSAVDISGGSTSNRANIQLYQKNNTHAQVFSVKVYDKWGLYSIRHASSGKSIDVAGGSSAVGTNVHLYEWNKSDAQLWRFVNAGNGFLYIQSKLGCYLDVSGGNSANNTNIHMWSFNGTNAQKWKLVKSAFVDTGSWMWPTKLRRTSCGFADNVYHTAHWHRGVDIPCSSGSDVYASKSGTVACVNYDSNRGNYIIIDHGNGYYSLYQHLKLVSKSKGNKVTQGDVIAKSGDTGSGGQHLHFEIWYLGSSGKTINNANVPWNNYSQYVNNNPKNMDKVYCTKSNDKKSGFKIGQLQGNGIPKANLVKTSTAASYGVYCYDNNGINYTFK